MGSNTGYKNWGDNGRTLHDPQRDKTYDENSTLTWCDLIINLCWWIRHDAIENTENMVVCACWWIYVLAVEAVSLAISELAAT
jgi:hypothetical protein